MLVVHRQFSIYKPLLACFSAPGARRCTPAHARRTYPPSCRPPGLLIRLSHSFEIGRGQNLIAPPTALSACSSSPPGGVGGARSTRFFSSTLSTVYHPMPMTAVVALPPGVMHQPQ